MRPRSRDGAHRDGDPAGAEPAPDRPGAGPPLSLTRPGSAGPSHDFPSFDCRLQPAAQLVRRDGRHLLVAERPLAALELTAAGFRLLARCRDGVRLEASAGELALLRRLASLGLVELRAAVDRWPSVRVVVPARDPGPRLAACLAALRDLSYPPDRLEVTVVDDGSRRPLAVPPGVRLLRSAAPAGPAAARNAGAAGAGTEVLAFLDSDCQAEAGWLEELVRELAEPGLAAAGGRVRGAGEGAWVERYEAVRSPLDLGWRPCVVGPKAAATYLVSASLAVRRTAFEAVGGFDERLRFGEDVDLSWRLAAAGWRLVYQPRSLVRHAHRDRLAELAVTRLHYAASEAALLKRHRGVRRTLTLSPGLAAALIAPMGMAGLAAETAAAVAGLRRETGLGSRALLAGLLRGHGAALHQGGRQIVRYYTLPALVAGLWRPRLIALVGAALLGPGLADWWRLRPRLGITAFCTAHLVDELAYHAGALLGCVQRRTLRPLRLRLLIDAPRLRAPASGRRPVETHDRDAL